MKLDFITIFPEFFEPLKLALLGKAQDKSLIEIGVHDLRDQATNIHRQVDDTPYGGGAGMVMTIQPIHDAIVHLKAERTYDEIIYLTPDGERLEQSACNRLSLTTNLMLICGHYKGIDQRLRDHFITREISIGDYVLSGGELPLLVIMESITRVLPGVLEKESASQIESFENETLEYPQYTRPKIWENHAVPEILTSGDHGKVAAWRQKQSQIRTRQWRPDLWEAWEMAHPGKKLDRNEEAG